MKTFSAKHSYESKNYVSMYNKIKNSKLKMTKEYKKT